jgi:cellobiose-specific phosphotransferase system component IIC
MPSIASIVVSQRTKVAAVIGETRSMKAIRNDILALTLTLIGAISMTHPSAAKAQATSPATTG